MSLSSKSNINVFNIFSKLTCFIVDEKIFALFQLVDAKKIKRFSEYLAELRVLLNWKLRGDSARVWILWTVNNYFFSRRHISSEQNGSIALLFSQNLFQVFEHDPVYAVHNLQLKIAVD